MWSPVVPATADEPADVLPTLQLLQDGHLRGGFVSIVNVHFNLEKCKTRQDIFTILPPFSGLVLAALQTQVLEQPADANVISLQEDWVYNKYEEFR